MAGAADSDYVCTLDEASIKKAQEELGEDPKNRLGAVVTLREWIVQQKYITCPTDTKFLLRFLRARKFSQLEARKLLENYLSRRQKFKQWFLNLDPSDAVIQKSLDAGIVVVLPGRDVEGRKVVMLRFGGVDVKKHKKDHFFRTVACVLEWMLLDETTQINGILQIVDFTGMTLKHQTFMTMEDRKNFIQSWQKHFPMRIKGIHMYNCGAFIEFALMIIKLAMTEKMQKRITTHSSLDSLYKFVPMTMWPEEYLPDEYDGPIAGSAQQIRDGTKRDMASPQVVETLKYLTREEFAADLSQKPDDIPAASFRKLNVD